MITVEDSVKKGLDLIRFTVKLAEQLQAADSSG